ncbi:MAG: protein kinase [Cyanobacteriota bacterium]|nr:protein kinase [Cyanobacteriota bacterium]
MSYCINPSCPRPNDSDNVNNRICRNCGSELLLQGRYQVMRLLSDSSGFGKVYEAYQGATPKILKVLKQKHNENPKVIELFQQEAAVLSQLNHPGIPKVPSDGYFQFTSSSCTEPVHCIVMEKIDGLDLKQWMRQQGNQPISEKQALNWLKQVANILHLVHQKNYFHRDIKPANIMIRSTGQLVLIDFGTARELTYTYLAEVGCGGNVTKISSVGYTPPEQEKGHAVPQSDFYALGRTFVYLLTGKQATDKAIYEPLTDRCHWRDLAPHISPQLADFIDKLMAPTAAARHKNTQDILDELDNLSQDLSQPKLVHNLDINPLDKPAFTSLSLLTKLKSVKKNWMIAGAVALVVGVGGYGTWKVYQQSFPNVITYENIPIATTLTGHFSFINYLVISPDGQTLASASADKTIKIWNLATGQEIRTLTGHSSFINYLVISPDGQTLASASADKTIKLWNLATGQEIRTFTGHSNYVNYLAISPDGQTLVSSSADKTIKVWNLATGQEIRTLTGYSKYIDYFVISSDWQTIATGSADKIIKIWNLSTGKEIHTLTGHSNTVNFVAISPDGQTLASASGDKTIKIWNLATGQEIRTLTGHSSFVNYLVISPDGQTVASASADKTIKVWNLATGQEIRTLAGHSSYVDYLVISSDGETLVSGSADKTIKIWNLTTGKEIRTLTGHSKPIARFAMSPDGQTIATGRGDNKISIWRLPKY